MNHNISFLISLFLIFFNPQALIAKKEKKGRKLKEETVLKKPSKEALDPVQKIISEYTLVGDFEQKPGERDLGVGFFWRYPMAIPEAAYEFPKDFGLEEDIIAVPGDGRAIEHMNMGRDLFLKKDFEKATATFLSARARYGEKNPFDRRNDYYIALALYNAALINWAKTPDLTLMSVRHGFANAATFLNWAFLIKRDIKDDFLEKVTPKSFFTLSVLYYHFKQFAASYGASTEGINFLRRTGREDYRSNLRQILAENYIRNHDYLGAIQQLDTAIRMDSRQFEVSKAFSRIGDIYFDLNNYELAEGVYELAGKLDQALHTKTPTNAILRGESLFWLKDFDQAKKNLFYGISTIKSKKSSTEELDLLSWANLRIADCFFIEHLTNEANATLREKAKVAYFDTIHDYPKSEAANIAQIRLSCLEITDATGKNKLHQRQNLEELQKKSLPFKATEIAFACDAKSYTAKERENLLMKVKGFLTLFPNSNYTKSFLNPLKEVRVDDLKKLFEEQKTLDALQFYETYKEDVFKDLDTALKINLFLANLEFNRALDAKFFWKNFKQEIKTPKDYVLGAVFLTEIAGLQKEHREENIKYGKNLEKNGAFFNLEIDENILDLIKRIQISDQRQPHQLWIAKLILAQKKLTESLICSHLFPSLSEVYNMDQKFTYEESKKIVNDQIPTFFESNKECAMQYIYLEEKSASKNKKDYFASWQKRLSWPITKPIVTLIWTQAEEALKLKDEKSANMFLEYLSKLDEKQFVEAKYAKFRLDPSKTQTQKLWGSSK